MTLHLNNLFFSKKHKLYKPKDFLRHIMKTQMITIQKNEYLKLKKASEIDFELVKKIKRSLEDIKTGRIKEWKDD